MLAMKFALLLLFAASAFGQTVEDRMKAFENPRFYSVRYDKFQKKTHVSYDALLTQGYSSLSMEEKVIIRDEGDAYFLFVFKARRNDFFNQPTLRLLADGKLIEMRSDTIGDIVVYIVPDLHLEKLAKAKKVEIQMNGFEGEFDEQALKCLKELYSLTKPPAAAPTVPRPN